MLDLKVKKRDGKIVNFNSEKIKNAVLCAIRATISERNKEQEKEASEIAKSVTEKLSSLKKPVVEIEEIQDLVEFELMARGHFKTMKNYILYRERRRLERELDSFRDFLKKYIEQDSDIVRQNANVVYSYPALRGYIADEVIKKWALEEMYPETISRAHKEAFIHIHDLGFANAVYCVGHDLRKLITLGFSGPKEHVAAGPAKHLSSLVGQMVNYLGVLQNEAAGAQAFNSVDTLLAPFVRIEKLSYEEVKQAIQQLVYGVNITSRWGQSPFVNFTFDFEPPEDLRDQNVLYGGSVVDGLKYGELRDEMRMINRAFWEIMLSGDHEGKIFTFPIPTINVTKDFDFDSEEKQLLLEATAKYGIPYFANFISSWLDPRAIRSMCCRLSLDLNEIKNYTGGLFGAADSTGSIGVVTLNLPRIAYVAKTSNAIDKIEKFFELLDYWLEIAKSSLEIKRKVIEKNMKRGLFPYLKKYLASFRTFFSTIGIVGSHEMCLNLLGKGIETEEGLRFTRRVLEYIRDKTQSFQRQTNNLYNFEATPAESTAYRFAKKDLEDFGERIAFSGTKDAPYYTNSSHLPVNFTNDLIFILKHQEKLQPLYTSGTVLHLFLPDKLDRESTKTLIKFVCEKSKIPYFSITPTYSICERCGYIEGEVYECPNCKRKTLIYSRVTGYYRPVRSWNRGKQSEFEDRKYYDIQKALA